MVAYIIIKAIKRANGYVLKADNGTYPDDKFVYKTSKDAYAACSKLWPSNSVWHGKKINNGYRITI